MAKRGSQFKTVQRPRVPRNKFDLSHERRMSADMFLLTPVLVEDCIPGDHFQIGNEIVLRMNPLVAPIMHEINVFTHYYFVPYRLLWDDWEKFITGGKDGDFTADLPRHTTGSDDIGSLKDYLGFNTLAPGQTRIKEPLVFPRRAYNMVYNEYYRDPNITDPVDLDWVNPETKDLHVRCWEKDYFTSALPWQQRGQAPAIPINGRLNVMASAGVPFNDFGVLINLNSGSRNWENGYVDGTPIFPSPTPTGHRMFVDVSDSATFDISSLRLGFAVQRFLERSARTGNRYVEFLKGHFPAYPRDDRLQRPEYIGGTKTPVVVSEVLQTSESNNTPQGNLSGHGISADRTYAGSYRVQEHGVILGIMSIMPRTMYSQGIDRVWLKDTKYDFYFPEFANLSEQAIYTEEIYNYGPEPIDKVVGYQSRYDEYRFKRNTIHGLFRTDFEFWHMGRKFANAPTLNEDLLRPNADERQAMKRVLAVPSEPMFLITFGNRLHVTRPMPYMAQPGLIDHN